VRKIDRALGRRIVVVVFAVVVGLLHFVTGPNYRGPFPTFVNGYLIDILLPTSLYFLLSLTEFALFRCWVVKSLSVFAVGVVVETAQFFGAPLLGRTFDPLDYVMYAVGVLLAAFLDVVLFPWLFPFWGPEGQAAARGG
jgi:hypothetical protein